MARVKYPFIVAYKMVDGLRFAKEVPEENPNFKRVVDQLDATIYTSYKQFRKHFFCSASAFMERNKAIVGNTIELIYVGE